MAYVTKEQVLALMPLADLIDALDDDASGHLDAVRLAAVLEGASGAVDALICSRYEVPLTTPPASVKRAALLFALDDLYTRRRVPPDQNPARKEAESWRSFLTGVGKGERQLESTATVAIAANSGGNPYVPGRVPLEDADSTY